VRARSAQDTSSGVTVLVATAVQIGVDAWVDLVGEVGVVRAGVCGVGQSTAESGATNVVAGGGSTSVG
jgi:hypothetical protein